MKKVFLSLVCLMSFTGLTACNSEKVDDTNSAMDYSSIIGVWRCRGGNENLLGFTENHNAVIFEYCDPSEYHDFPDVENGTIQLDMEGVELTDITREEDTVDFRIYTLHIEGEESTPYVILDRYGDLYQESDDDVDYILSNEGLRLVYNLEGGVKEDLTLKAIGSQSFSMTTENGTEIQFVREKHLDALIEYLN